MKCTCNDPGCLFNPVSPAKSYYEWTDTNRAMTNALERLCIQLIQLPKCEETALHFAKITLINITKGIPRGFSIDWLTDRLTQVCIDLEANERNL